MSAEVTTIQTGVRRPLTVPELQALLSKSRPWVYRAMRLGLIKYVRFGDSRHIPPEEADRIMREGIPSLRPADAPPHRRHRFPRKGEEAA
jgi:hypothetical protein